MLRVKWFKHSHEQRNYWLRFGLMRLHVLGQIHYEEWPLEACVAAGYDHAVATHTHRHTSVILVESKGQCVRCIVDSEDSFFLCQQSLNTQMYIFVLGTIGIFSLIKRFLHHTRGMNT